MEDYKDEGQEHNTQDTKITFVWDQSVTPLSIIIPRNFYHIFPSLKVWFIFLQTDAAQLKYQLQQFFEMSLVRGEMLENCYVVNKVSFKPLGKYLVIV